MKVHGMDISIETDKGECRHWYDPHNDENGVTKMKYPYGYIRRTEGADDEHVDVYVGPSIEGTTVYVIHQNKAPDFNEYDEDKVMIGFESAKDAKQAYLGHYNNPKFFGSMDIMSIDEFKDNFVNKALSDTQNSNSIIPKVNPYDMMNMRAVQAQLSKIGSMNDKELEKLVSVVWGDGYKYVPITTNHIRSEMRGFLQDQLEWLRLINPAMASIDPNFSPDKMPHSSDWSETSNYGQNISGALLQEKNLDGIISKDEVPPEDQDM